MSTGERGAEPTVIDLHTRVPGHSLIEKLLAESETGRIRTEGGTVVIDDESVGWYWGVFGERRTAESLRYLGPGWTVLHSVPIGTGGRDIDHVVVGPPGVFVINSKDHRGKSIWAGGYGLKVDGQKRSGYIQGVLKDIAIAEDKLSRGTGFTVEVRGAISFISPRTLKVTAPPGSAEHPIIVTSDDYIASKLRAFRQEYSEEQIARIVEAAADPFTWMKAAPRSRPGATLQLEFDALATELGPLIERRVRARQEAPAVAARPAVTRPTRRQAAARRKSTKSRALSVLLRLGLGIGALWLLLGVILPAVFSALSHR